MKNQEHLETLRFVIASQATGPGQARGGEPALRTAGLASASELSEASDRRLARSHRRLFPPTKGDRDYVDARILLWY